MQTSTPNGTQGIGAFFFDYWQKAVDSDLLFEIDTKSTKEDETNQNLVFENFTNNADEIMASPNHNSFIKVKFHWSEDPRRNDLWYQKQKQELNFDKRKIGQELDLEFVGASSNPFDDDILRKLQESVLTPIAQKKFPHSSILNIYKDIDPKDHYILGIDFLVD